MSIVALHVILLLSMSPLVSSLLAAAVMALIAFVGFGSLLIARKRLAQWLSVFVAFAAGSLLGAAFFHLLPESIGLGGPTFALTLVGLLTFFAIDSLLWVYHCHAGHRLHEQGHLHGSCPPRQVGVLNLVGDSIHNFTDGIVLASAFLVSPAVGLAAAFATAMHEIPQEISDFGILVHSGFKPRRALFWNGLVALFTMLGVLATFVAADYVTGLTRYTIPFAAGGFLYMSCTNLLSEIKEEESLGRRLWQTAFLLVGVLLLWVTSLAA